MLHIHGRGKNALFYASTNTADQIVMVEGMFQFQAGGQSAAEHQQREQQDPEQRRQHHRWPSRRGRRIRRTDGHRLVIVRPVSPLSFDNIPIDEYGNANAVSSLEETSVEGRQRRRSQQWPLYDQLCQSYGFSVEVERMFDLHSHVDGDRDVNNDSEKHDEEDDDEPGGARGGEGPRVNEFLLVVSDNDRGGHVSGHHKRVAMRIAMPLRCIGERLVVRVPPQPMLGNHQRVGPLASSFFNEDRRFKAEEAGPINRNEDVINDNDSGGSKCYDTIVGGRMAVGRGGMDDATFPPGRRCRPLKDGEVIETLDGDPHPTFAKLYDMMCRKEKLVLEVKVADWRIRNDCFNVAAGSVYGSDKARAEIANNYCGDHDSDNDCDSSRHHHATGTGAVSKLVGLVNEEKEHVLPKVMPTAASNAVGLREAAKKRIHLRWGTSVKGNGENLGEEERLSGKDGAPHSFSHQGNRHGATASQLPSNCEDLNHKERKRDCDIQNGTNCKICNNRYFPNDTARSAWNDNNMPLRKHRKVEGENGGDDVKHELALFNTIDGHLANNQNERKLQQLPSFNDDYRDKVLGSSQQRGSKEKDGSPPLLRKLLTLQPCSIQTATGGATRTNMPKDSNCPVPAMATTSSVANNVTTLLLGHEGLNSTSSSSYPALLKGNADEEDDESSSSSADSNCPVPAMATTSSVANNVTTLLLGHEGLNSTSSSSYPALLKGNADEEDDESSSSSASSSSSSSLPSSSSSSSSSDSSSSSNNSYVVDNMCNEKDWRPPTAIQTLNKTDLTQPSKISKASRLPMRDPSSASCPEPAVATTSSVTNNITTLLLCHEGLNSTSSPSVPALFEDNVDEEDDTSSSSATSSSSSSSSSSDSSSSRNDSNVIDVISNEKELRPPTDIQTLNKTALTQSSKISKANCLPIRDPPTVISSLKTRSMSTSIAKPIAPTSLSRLWPDPSDIIKALTRWTPPSVRVQSTFVNKSGLIQSAVEFYGPIRNNDSAHILSKRTGSNNKDQAPSEFKNANEIMEVMALPLLSEGLCSLNGDYQAERKGNDRWKRELYRMRLTKITEVTPIFHSESYFDDAIKMYEAQFSSLGESRILPSNLSELYCVHFERWDDSKFGIVAHDFPTTFTFRKNSEGRSLLKLWLVVHENEQQTKETGWLSRKDFKKLLDPHKNGQIVHENAILTLMSCGSTTNVVRQFEAIKSLPYLSAHLQRALFTPLIADPPKVIPTSKPRSLPIDIWRYLTQSHNKFQLKSISHVLTGSCRENVCLVQGPPGTGKSSTIVGLVTALLSGKAPLPNQRQSGCLIHPGKTMGITNFEPQARNRILVCAATNVAVDNLAWKIKIGSLGPSGKTGDFNMARFGSLPWENSRDLSDQKPETLSPMDDFLWEINVDRRASDGAQDFEYDDHEPDGYQCWSPENQKHNRKKRRKIVGRAYLRSQILGTCSVVVTTLSGAGSKAFIDGVCRDPTRNDSEFDAVIIDEACQASEPESLIPFKFNPTTVTLVGDPKQLPVLTLSSSSLKNFFERSLFERLQSLNFPTMLLRNQYRMHEDIANFPSKMFYSSKLITPNTVKERPTPLWACPAFPTLCFWDVNGRDMSAGVNGHGFTNVEEATFITRTLLSTFANTFLKRSDVVTVGIISFYKDQVNLLRDQISKVPALKNSMLNIKVATVDGFQGSECDIIVLSCVRSHSRFRTVGQTRNSVGFLEDYRRVNVAITRAKCSLWIVGNEEVLKSSELWWKLLQEMYQRRNLRRAADFREIFSRWKASEEAKSTFS